VSVQSYLLPQSLEEAVALLAEDDSLLVMAGGTITMPLINEGITTPDRVMGLRHTGLDFVSRSNGSLKIGATATISQMLEQNDIAMLREGARNTASWTIRNMATAGGNLFAPPPAGDLAVALLALDAELRLVSQGSERIVPLAEFYTGFLSNVMRPDELLAEIIVPVPAGTTAYLKYGRKHAHTPSIVTVAIHIIGDGATVERARIALNGVGQHPLRARQAEAILENGGLNDSTIELAAIAASEECEPFTDAIATAWYRQRMVKVYVGRVLQQIAGGER
jgi:CO/xanthine dehydrogenase FAD-binding subunit